MRVDNVSQAVLDHSGEGSSETSWLLKLANDWFDAHNSSEKRRDGRKRTHEFGLQMDIQSDILEKVTDFFLNAPVDGKKTMQPFQKGIVMNNNALPLLLENLKPYGVHFLLTRRLNRTSIRVFLWGYSKGGLHDHPSAKEFTFRLRNCILSNIVYYMNSTPI